MKRKRHIFIGSLIAALLAFGVSSFVAYEQVRSLPDYVHIGEIALGGMNWDMAIHPVRAVIQDLQDQKYKIITDNGIAKAFRAEELGIHYDAERTLMKMFDDTSWFVNLFRKDAALAVEKKSYSPFVIIDREILKSQVESFLFEQENDYSNAWLVWDQGKWNIGNDVAGRILESDAEIEMVDQIAQWASSFDAGERTLRALYEMIPAKIASGDLHELQSRINFVAQDSFPIQFNGENSDFSFGNSPHWFVIDEREREYRFNTKFAEQWVEEYSLDRDQEPGKVILTGLQEEVSEYDGKVLKRAVFEGEFKHGLIIDQESLHQELVKSFSDKEERYWVSVEWNHVPPKIVSLVKDYQFPDLLSTGISSFQYGNHPNRVKNIQLSLSSFNGVIIEPGEQFSFNRVTGWITPRKGYTKTKIIMDGRVVEGIGGGVCQTSTTVYRSILNAGFPVIERRNHSLDIVYYQSYGYGLDATVYTDSRNDLRWTNDFPGPVLMNTFTDENNLAYVEFYGVSDDRQVMLTPIPTGDYLSKRWEWKIIWPDREDVRTVMSRYKEEKQDVVAEDVNPLEA